MNRVEYFYGEPSEAVFELKRWLGENPSIQVISSNMSVIEGGNRDLMHIIVICQERDSNTPRQNTGKASLERRPNYKPYKLYRPKK